MELHKDITLIAANAKEGARKLATFSTDAKNKALSEIALAIMNSKASILTANREDLKRARAKKLSGAIIDRLRLDDKRIAGMAESIESVAKLPDPVGKIMGETKRPNGLIIKKVSVPIGLIAVIYESRPNVTADCAALCVKSGNGLILRGGSEAISSNLAIFAAIKDGATKANLPENSVSFIKTTDRKAVDALLSLDKIVDLVIPRGGASLIEKVTRTSKIPVIKHDKGVCHVYVDESADLNMAEAISFNAKVQRPGVCNAM